MPPIFDASSVISDWHEPIAAFYETARTLSPSFDASYCLCDAILLTQIEVPSPGAPVYRLKNRLLIAPQYEPGRNRWLFGHYDISDYFGAGDNPITAQNEWALEIHCRFQRLYSILPHQMSPEDYAQWRKFEDRLDIATYTYETPIKMREIGFLTRRGHQFRIQWLDGRHEIVDLKSMIIPPEFHTLPQGAPFEAVTLREYKTARLLGFVVCERRRSIESQFEAVRESLPVKSLDDLPSGNPWGAYIPKLAPARDEPT